jgi:hypothetical protein
MQRQGEEWECFIIVFGGESNQRSPGRLPPRSQIESRSGRCIGEPLPQGSPIIPAHGSIGPANDGHLGILLIDFGQVGHATSENQIFWSGEAQAP